MSKISTDLSHTALLLVDIQQGFNHPTHWGLKRSNPAFEANIVQLLAAFRAAQPCSTTPPNIFHVCHYSVLPRSPLHPSKPGVNFQPYATPAGSEPVFPKTVNSPFIETSLEDALREKRINNLFICGLMTNHCVDTTVRMAANLHVVDFDDVEGRITLIGDATAAYEQGEFDGETVHGVHVASLKGEFCDVATTRETLEELQRMVQEAKGARESKL
jgi:nicotinamidase-related amidase